MRLPSSYMLLTTTALLVTSSTASLEQLHVTRSNVLGSEPPAKVKSTASQSDARSHDEERVLPPPNYRPLLNKIGEEGSYIHMALAFISKELETTKDVSNEAGGSTREFAMHESAKFNPVLKQGNQLMQDGTKVGNSFSPASLRTKLSNQPVELLLASLYKYNLQFNSERRLDPAVVLRAIYTDAEFLEVIVKAMKEPKMVAIATELKNGLMRLLFEDMITAGQEFKLLQLREDQPMNSWLATAFVPFSPFRNYEKLEAWRVDGLITDDMMELLLDEPTEVSINDGSMIRAFATYIGLLNTGLFPERLTLFESLTAYFGDYNVARMGIAGRSGGDAALENFTLKLKDMQIDFWIENEQNPRDVFLGLRLSSLYNFPQLLLAHWVKFVDLFNEKSTIDAVTSYSLIDEFYPNKFDLALSLSATETSPGMDKVMVRLREEQANSWLDSFESQVSVFKLLRLDVKTGSIFFKRPLKSWIAFIKASSERYPNTIYHPIQQLSRVYSDRILAKSITEALKNPNTVELATQLEDGLFRRWLYNLKTPEDMDLYFEGDQLYELVRFHYRQFYSVLGRGKLIEGTPEHWLANYHMLNDFYQNLPTDATNKNVSNVKLLYAYAMYVNFCNEHNRVDPLDLFALLHARFGARRVVEIFVEGMALVKSSKFSTEHTVENEIVISAVTSVKNRQIFIWQYKRVSPGTLFEELRLNNANRLYQSGLDLWLEYVDNYNKYVASDTITPYAILKEYYNPLILAHIYSKLTISSGLEVAAKQIEEDVAYFWKHTDMTPDKIFATLPLSFKEKQAFDQSTMLWLECSDRYRMAHPETSFRAIRTLKTVYTDKELVDMINVAAYDEGMKGVAERLKGDLWRTWMNDLHTPKMLFTLQVDVPMVNNYYVWYKETISAFTHQVNGGEFVLDGTTLVNAVAYANSINEDYFLEPISVYAILRSRFDEASVTKFVYSTDNDAFGGYEPALERLQKEQTDCWLRTRQRPIDKLPTLKLILDSTKLVNFDHFRAFVQFSLDYSALYSMEPSPLTVVRKYFSDDSLITWLFKETNIPFRSQIEAMTWVDKSNKVDLLKILEVNPTTDKGILVLLWMKYVATIKGLGASFEVNDQTIHLLRSTYSDARMIWMLKLIDEKAPTNFAEQFRQHLLHVWLTANLLPSDLRFLLGQEIELSWGRRLYEQFDRLFLNANRYTYAR